MNIEYLFCLNAKIASWMESIICLICLILNLNGSFDRKLVNKT